MATNEMIRIGELVNNSEKTVNPTGYEILDSIIKGWIPGTLNVIAGRPECGKTSLLLDLASRAASAGIPTLLYSLEMPSTAIAKRIVKRCLKGTAAESIPQKDTAEFRSLEDKLKSFSQMPLYIDDTPGLRTDELEQKLREAIRTINIRLVFIDYLQLMRGPESFSGSLEEQTDFCVKKLHFLSREMGIPIITAAQMTHYIFSRSKMDSFPTIDDFFGSQELGVVPDSIMLMAKDRFKLVKSLEGPSRCVFDAAFDQESLSFVEIKRHEDTLHKEE